MNRILPLLVFVVTATVGLGMTYTVYWYVKTAQHSRFEVVAEEIVDRIHERQSQYIALLVATRSLFVANNGSISREVFRDFVAGLDLDGRFNGIQGVGYARYIPAAGEGNVEAEILDSYDLKVSIWPETEQQFRTPIMLLEPFDERNREAIGYDMYSDDIRRLAMERAADTDTLQASGPVELMQEITSQKQVGFVVYLSLPNPPVSDGGSIGPEYSISGFIFAHFRAGDLITATLNRSPRPPVVVEVRDSHDETASLIFRSPDFDDFRTGYSVERPLDIAGREWIVRIKATPDFGGKEPFLSVYLLGAISLLFAAALAVSTRSQLRAVDVARKLHAVSLKTVEEKELMLQEMKHRIKNSLSRVLAIARQTSANSETLDEFASSFSSRMQAMANAQDMLTRSDWNRADLRKLLESELTQVFEDDGSRCEMDGPSVLLDEKTTQALGLTFHELATNAMKYGAMAQDTGHLGVHWSLTGRARKRRLVIEWREEFSTAADPPEGTGFGTRLIDANIKGELGGAISRQFDAAGLTIRIDIPHESAGRSR